MGFRHKNIEKSTKRNKTIKFKLNLVSTTIFLGLVLTITLISFGVYYFNISSFVSEQINVASRQILNNYNSYFNSAIEVINTVQTRIDNIDIEQNSDELGLFLDDVKEIKKDILNIALYKKDGTFVASNHRYTPTNVKEESWFKDALEEPNISIFSNISRISDEIYRFTASRCLSYGTSVNGAVLKIDLDFNEITKFTLPLDLGENGKVIIFDNYYNVVYTSLNNGIDGIEYIKEIVLGNKIVNLPNGEFNLFISPISNTSWRIAIFSNYQKASQSINIFNILISISALVALVTFIVITLLSIDVITKPIKRLQEEIVNVSNLNFDVAVFKKIKGSKEIEDLSSSFNEMMERIKNLTNDIINEKELQRKSELKALQNQINPHFLYNTLDSIVYLIDSNENEKASEMIISLSKFFRISISRGRTIIPLKEELEHVKLYLTIQKIRFGDKFNYLIDIDERLFNYQIIKLILQPIVENAIVHGLKEMEEPSNIIIKGKIENNFIVFDVIDNGFGILPNKIKEIYKSFEDKNLHNGVGIKNVYERLKIYYGNDSEIKIFSNLDEGTDIRIFIPLKETIPDEK